MLRHLRVTNFAILSDVEIELGPGMNVLTGETGAGKSLIVEAVNLLRGGRASADIPRTGSDEAVVEAIVEVPADLRDRVAGVLEGAGLPGLGSQGDADEVFIRRVIQRGGRSRTYVNGALTTAARLAELGALLIDLSGQHQHQGLVDPSRHRELLDAFGAAEPLVAAMAAAWAELRRCDDALAELGGDEREREARIDYLRHQLDELDAAAFTPGEDQTVELERVRLASVDLLQGAARAAEDVLYASDDSARDRVAAAAREVERGMRTDATLEPIARQLVEIETLIDDAADQLRSYADRLEGDPERLAYLDERLALIRRLLRKHGAANLDDILAKATSLRAELDTLAGRDTILAEVLAARTKAEAAALSAAAALTASRRKAARKLEKEVASHLADLGMASARLHVSIETLDGSIDASSLAASSASSASSTSATSASATSASSASSGASLASSATSGASSATSATSGASPATSGASPASASASSGSPGSSTSVRTSSATNTSSRTSASLSSASVSTGASGASRLSGASGASRLSGASGASRLSGASGASNAPGASGSGAFTASIASAGVGASNGIGSSGSASRASSSSPSSAPSRLRGLGPHGADRVELVLASNKGEDARPLAKVASGGELSRIMLALKLGLQSAGRAEHVATYVFDEVDTGIGGATAHAVASQIRAVAGDRGSGAHGRQVLCVTHLPQIAAYADQHYHVEKTEVGGRTETHVTKLTGTARKDELARMLGGQATSKAKAHAAELLAEASRAPSKRTARASSSSA